jgi:hypothetical protein
MQSERLTFNTGELKKENGMCPYFKEETMKDLFSKSMSRRSFLAALVAGMASTAANVELKKETKNGIKKI